MNVVYDKFKEEKNTLVCETETANGRKRRMSYETKALHIHIHDHYTTEKNFGTRILKGNPTKL